MEFMLQGRWEDRHYVQYFRMRKGHFFELCDSLRPHLTSGQTNYKQSITVEHKVAITMYYLAHRDTSQHSMALIFGVSQPSVSEIIQVVVDAIHENMYDTYIRRLNATEVTDTMAAFASRGMPGCIGAIDGTHVMIRKPACSYVENFFNVRYDSFTLQVQVVCDYNRRFWDADIGRAGTVHDAHVLRESELFNDAQSVVLCTTQQTKTAFQQSKCMLYAHAGT
eukprot:364841-Chlamydomonas_euryale.AAC.3